MDEVLQGGVANAGAVYRRGDMVFRPASPYSKLIQDYLSALRATGFNGVPNPVGLTAQHEEFEFIRGEVAIPPYPLWAQADSALVSVARLMRRFHDASQLISKSFVDQNWNDAFGPWPTPGETICHFDVCLENVVFRDGEAVAFLDFDFAAPGEPIDDLASLTRMCVPLDDSLRLQQLGWTEVDIARRLRRAVDGYGLTESDRARFLDRLSDSIYRAEMFVRIRVDRGEPNFVAMWESFGGDKRFDRRRQWFDKNRDQFQVALVESDGNAKLLRS